MATPTRQLSPHLTIYKPQLTSLLSILHRASGVVLAIGTLLVCYWLLAAAAGPEAFTNAQQLFSSWPGQLVLLGWSWATLYHLSNGIRHLCWDLGWGLELKTVYRSGTAVVLASLLLTLLLWSIA
jgi:succinate dehydrogenase / fumarate reductase cytochrome b subunit